MTRYHFLLAALVCLAIAIGGTMYRHRARFDAQSCGDNTLIHSDGSKTTTPGICNATTRVENDIIHGDYVPASLFDVTVQNSEVYLRKAGAPADARAWTPQPKDQLRGDLVYLEP